MFSGDEQSYQSVDIDNQMNIDDKDTIKAPQVELSEEANHIKIYGKFQTRSWRKEMNESLSASKKMQEGD